MDPIHKLSPLNQSILTNNTVQQPKIDMSQSPDTIEINGKIKTLSTKKKILIVTGILAATASITALILKGKTSKAQETLNGLETELNTLIEKTKNEIKFTNGIATDPKTNEKFTGVIKDSISKSKSGNTNFKPFNYTLEYKDGILIKSNKIQDKNIIEKTFQTLEDGSRKITTTTNGKTQEKILNPKTLKTDIQKSQNAYEKLLQEKDNLTSTEFNKKANDIKYTSAKQKEEVKTVYGAKVAMEDEAKKAAEEAKLSAQKAAKEAEAKAAKEAEAIAEQNKILDSIKKSIKPDEELNKMSEKELLEYEKQMCQQMRSLSSKYAKHTAPKDYSEVDFDLYQKINHSRLFADDRVNDIRKIAKYNEILPKMENTTPVKVKDKSTGKDIELSLQKVIPNYGGSYQIQALGDKSLYGIAEISMPGGYDFIPNLPEKYCDNALEIKFLSSSQFAKGTGKELVKQAVADSKKLGYDGKVWLDACGGSLPSRMSALAGEKIKSTPVPFYYKCGFRFKDESLNKLAQEGIENLNKGLKYNGPNEGVMFLADEAISKILNS